MSIIESQIAASIWLPMGVAPRDVEAILLLTKDRMPTVGYWHEDGEKWALNGDPSTILREKPIAWARINLPRKGDDGK